MKRRHPAEWEAQRAVWLSWPHNVHEWHADRLPRIRDFFRRLIESILDFQDVKLALASPDFLKDVETLTRSSGRFACEPVVIPNNDIWIRDYGPFFIQPAGRSSGMILDFGFNAWGGKFPPWDLDDAFPARVADLLKLPLEVHREILEGGSVDFSGDGILMTTEQCLLQPTRNPSLGRGAIETLLKSAFGVDAVIWLKEGLEGDHTDGHVDDIARFVGPRRVVACRSDDPRDPNHRRLQENLVILRSWRHPVTAERLDIVELPMPHRMDLGQDRLPNSYANFIFVNGGVLVPTFGGETDGEALDLFRGLFPDRRVVDVDCALLIEEGGGLHCMTRQEPLLA